MSYGELYALWERQNWRAHELDFSVDREQWLAAPAEAQEHTTWSLGSFYIGEERVTADLAPFLMAAPSGEVEVFLATQLVDEARHAVFFDRFGAEVMALDARRPARAADELQKLMIRPWYEVFDDGLRDVADRIKADPHDFGLFVEGVTTYHLIIEGVLAMTGQRFILKYMEDHGMYPGFCKGFSLVEQDEHRHIAFGVRFLKDAVAADPRYGEIIQRRVAELVPRAAGVFVPPYVDDPREFNELRLPLVAHLRVRVPEAEAADGGARPRRAAAGRADAGADRVARGGARRRRAGLGGAGRARPPARDPAPRGYDPAR